MNKEDMRRLMVYARIRSKQRGLRLSQITVEECIEDMHSWEKGIFVYALPVLDNNRFLILPK